MENIDLTADEAAQVMDEMMSGEAEQINMASFLTALRMKGKQSRRLPHLQSV